MDGFNDASDSTPLPYTSSPVELLVSELKLIRDILLHYPASIPGVLQPIWSWKPEDELCILKLENVKSLLLHGVLLITQSSFLLALLYALIIPVPTSAYLAGITLSLTLNYYFCKLLNGSGEPQTSTTDLTPFPRHDDECWIFINGVSVGRSWFQSNLNVLSLIFRRPITGVHNITYGIIFDLIECLIQRDACYATADIRTGYAEVKKCLLNATYKKVVLIVHSQGGIEGGAIFDWLLDDLPADKLRKLEVYTFGSAANHFNNPSRNCKKDSRLGVVRHIEHYTNAGDFVARFGLLGFIRPPQNSRPRSSSGEGNAAAAEGEAGAGAGSDASRDNNRFKGRLFKRNASGHMLNQHYLAPMFPREVYTLEDGVTRAERVKVGGNAFMDSAASAWDDGLDALSLGWGSGLRRLVRRWQGEGEARQWESMVREDGIDLSGAGEGIPGRTPRELSRLWAYRDGMSPPNEEEEEDEEGRKVHAHLHIQEEGWRIRVGNGVNGVVMNGSVR